jgi:hypothetical protein
VPGNLEQPAAESGSDFVFVVVTDSRRVSRAILGNGKAIVKNRDVAWPKLRSRVAILEG